MDLCISERALSSALQSRIVHVLAKTIYGEACGGSVTLKEAIACVILNRFAYACAAGGTYWWGHTLEDICLRCDQFHCWDPRGSMIDVFQTLDTTNPDFASCVRIALRALDGLLDDPTYASTHYHLENREPHWARARAPVVMIDHHLFYNNVEGTS